MLAISSDANVLGIFNTPDPLEQRSTLKCVLISVQFAVFLLMSYIIDINTFWSTGCNSLTIVVSKIVHSFSILFRITRYRIIASPKMPFILLKKCIRNFFAYILLPRQLSDIFPYSGLCLWSNIMWNLHHHPKKD